MTRLYLRNRLCIPVRGYNRSVIYDLVRNDYFFITQEMFDLINTLDLINFQSLENVNNQSEMKDFLLNEEVIFEILDIVEKNNFPALNHEFLTPFIISDLIIHDNLEDPEIEKILSYDYQHISIIIKNFNKDVVIEFVKKIAIMEVDSISLFITEENMTFYYHDFIEFNQINQLYNIYVFNSRYNAEISNRFELINIIEIDSSFNEFSKNVKPNKLRINYTIYLEALNHHTYFHKKVYLDIEGNIRNGISGDQSFGNLKDISTQHLSAILQSDEFQKLGNVKKDNTLVCNVCEFRYMCVDSRLPINGDSGRWSHINECTYNPYISKWNYEDGYKSLSNVGIKINHDSGTLSIDNIVLDKHKKLLWG